MFDLIGILTESNDPSFFEHNMRFLCYSAAQCDHINRFQSKGKAQNASFFVVFLHPIVRITHAVCYMGPYRLTIPKPGASNSYILEKMPNSKLYVIKYFLHEYKII